MFKINVHIYFNAMVIYSQVSNCSVKEVFLTCILFQNLSDQNNFNN